MSKRLKQHMVDGYREGPGSTFTHNGREYPLDAFLERAAELPIQVFQVKDLSWMLKGEHPNPKRVAAASLDYPILVTDDPEYGLVTIDGFHRVVKAAHERRQTIEGRLIPSEWFDEIATL